jgi:hypothetical protein
MVPHLRPARQGAPEADRFHQGCHNIFFYFQKLICGCRLVTADTTNESFFVRLHWYRLGLVDITNILPADTKSSFCSSGCFLTL